MLSSLLSQFRQRYPQGSLLSDLLTIHDGLYVVRVCAGVDGLTLASGLGANTTLEAAEDIATTRALERLIVSVAPPTSLVPSPGLQPSSLPSNGLLANGLQPEILQSDSLDTSAPAPPARLKSAVSPTADSQVGVPAAEGQTLLSVVPPSQPVDMPKAPGLDLPPTALASPPRAKSAAQPTESLPPDFLPEEPLAGSVDDRDEFMDLGSGPAVAVDLSDIIAQTDVELQRLGWGVNQGREFLEKTYGKRSRHDLTDDELLEFLLYLETQPTPGSP
ncbi:hypothetical protein ACQ4N7_01355 [Nodosilinea sp. AN01ver1]|uniref:hypothetical protein n=1 Tax=Nodosilinea sp. AN01ver1 TaxID=3423362 RepID=UPI003D31FE1C